MRTFTRTVNENRKRQLKETNFMKIVYDPKGSGCHNDRDTLVGHVDSNTMLIHGTHDDGLDYFELRMGSKYTIGGNSSSSYSKKYDTDSLPPKWREAANELIQSRENGFDDLVAEKLNESQLLGDHYFFGEGQWETLKKMCKKLFKVKIIKDGDMEIIYDISHKLIYAKWDVVDSEVWVDTLDYILFAIVSRKSDEMLKREYNKSLNESIEDGFESGDRIRITKGKWENQIGELDLIMSDTYIVKLNNDTTVEVDKENVTKVK